jgi:hypothetical protein
MGICCSREGGREELEEAEGWFPWKHDDFLQEQLSGAAGVSMHTKQGWKGVNQDAMAACQVSSNLSFASSHAIAVST